MSDYQKGDPNCMKESEAMKNITVLYHCTDTRSIEAGGEYNIGDKIGIVTFKAIKSEGFEKW